MALPAVLLAVGVGVTAVATITFCCTCLKNRKMNKTSLLDQPQTFSKDDLLSDKPLPTLTSSLAENVALGKATEGKKER